VEDFDELITRQECKELIDAAIRRHNRNAGIISSIVGWLVLALFADGILRLTGKLPSILNVSLN
jgi:hypothetical protein